MGVQTTVKPRDVLALLDHKGGAPLPPDDPGAELILTLLAHVLVADRSIDDDELELLARVVPQGKDAHSYFESLAKQTLDWELLATTYPDRKDRRDLVTLAEQVLWGDGLEHEAELDAIDELAAKLGVS